MKKFSAIVLTVVLCLSAVVALVACGPQKSTSNFEVPDVGYDGSEVEIKFMNTMGKALNDKLTQYIAEFNKLYPNIKVTVDNSIKKYPDLYSDISTNLTVGGQPNIAYCYPDHVAGYNVAKAVVTLDSLIESTIEVTRADGKTEPLGLTQAQIDDYVKGYWDEGKSYGDGLMYSMPYSKSTEVLYYNKTFFDEKGISVPDHWFSKDENDKTSVEYVCQAILKEDSNNCIPLGIDSEDNWFITMCEQYNSGYTSFNNGVASFDFNNETNREFVKKFSEWYRKGYFTTQSILGTYTSSIFKVIPGVKDYAKDAVHSYMSIGSSAGATYQRPNALEDNKYPFEVGIARIPQIDNDNPKAISQGPSVCIFKKDNPQEVVASWLLVKYLTTSVEYQAEVSMVSGYMPVIKSAQGNAVYNAWLEKANGGAQIQALSVKVGVANENSYYTSPAFVGSAESRTAVGNLMVSCFKITENIEQQISKAFQDAIDECKYKAM